MQMFVFGVKTDAVKEKEGLSPRHAVQANHPCLMCERERESILTQIKAGAYGTQGESLL